ncbi:MAG: flavin oxidoreductase/NADH oxidase [Clostridia bacterium]|nr:flavin oxidoreductase/NADH oxidase [Clostridia bacterium]
MIISETEKFAPLQPLATPFVKGKVKFQNRVCFQPMEGCDCHEDGSPSELTIEKYIKAAKSGAGLVWFEANAVCPEGRTNPRQMMLTADNLPKFKELLSDMRAIAEKEMNISPVFILQLTHSGRQSIEPMIVYRNPVYEERRPVSDDAIVTDEYLDTLPIKYAESARLAIEAGFDGVDVKSCHGYLFQELLSGFTREGKYGGSFENRTKLYIDSIREVKEVIGDDYLLTTRLSVSDMIPKPYGFGTDEEGRLDFTEPDRLIEILCDEGISILNVTVGNPYYNPHVNRPYRQGGYVPPESADEGLARFEIIQRHIKEKFPSLTVIGSGVSYYRDDLISQSERMLREGICDVVGYGRVSLAYPMFYRDSLKGEFNAKKCCLACSKCTLLMRAHQVSGCAVFNEYYRDLYRRTCMNK